LRSIDKFIRSNCTLPYKEAPTVLYKDNSACVTKIQAGFIKGDRTKHIDPKKFSFTNDLITNKALDVKKIALADNLADLFTKALLLSIHHRLVHGIEMRRLNILEQEIQ